MKAEAMKTDVRSRFIANHPKLDILETTSPYGGLQVDLGIETKAQREVDVQVIMEPLPYTRISFI